jgi:hypothetical protein
LASKLPTRSSADPRVVILLLALARGTNNSAKSSDAMSELGQARRKPSRGIPEPNQRAYESGDGTAGDVLHRRSRRGTGMSIRYNRSCEQRETLVPLDGIERGHHRHSTEDGRVR